MRRLLSFRSTPKRTLDLPGLDPAEGPVVAERTRASLADVDRDRRTFERRIADAVAHREEHREAVAALRTIVGERTDLGRAIDHAQDALATVLRWESAAQRRGELRHQLAEVDATAQRQERAR